MSAVAAPVRGARAEAPSAPRPTCATCAHFRSDARELEQAIPGLLSFGSGFAAVRASDGLCGVHERYLASSGWCAQHAARG